MMSDKPQYLEQRYKNHYNKKTVTLGDLEFKPRTLFITKKVTDRVNNTETYYIEVKRDVEDEMAKG